MPRPKRRASTPKQVPPLTIDTTKSQRPPSLNLSALLTPKELKRSEPDTPPPQYSPAAPQHDRPLKKRTLHATCRLAPAPVPAPPTVVTVFRDVGAPKGQFNALGLYMKTAAERRLPAAPKHCVWQGPFYHAVDASRAVQMAHRPQRFAQHTPSPEETEAAKNKHAVDMAREARSPRRAAKPLPPAPPVEVPECSGCQTAPVGAFISLGQAARLGAWVVGASLLSAATWQVAGYYFLWLGSCELFALVAPKPSSDA